MHTARSVAPQAMLFQNPQELGLGGERRLADLVEEECSGVGFLQEPLARSDSSIQTGTRQK
jgi:hypothetical protein